MRSVDIIIMSLALILCACATSPKDMKKPPVRVEPVPIDAHERPSEESSVNEIIPADIEHVYTDQEPQAVEQIPKTYPPLSYGVPKPLVCSREYLATEALAERPNLQLMWEHYLYERPERVWEEVGGVVEYNGCLPEVKGGWRNACTVRLSHMLNKAGHKIPYIKGQTVSGESGDQYFFRLDDAQAYIEKTFGDPDIAFDLPGRLFDPPQEPGLFIIKFAGDGFTGHATIWNGAGAVDGVDIVGYEIFFWKLPCFIPSSRNGEEQ